MCPFILNNVFNLLVNLLLGNLKIKSAVATHKIHFFIFHFNFFFNSLLIPKNG